MDDERKWRNRLLAYSAVRFGGLAIFFVGIAIAYSDLVREGGWPLLGGILVAIGAIDAVVAPRILKKSWERLDK